MPAAAGALALLLLVVPSTPAGAQQTVREVQVPVDTAGVVLEVGPELRSDAGLFPEVADFRHARLFRLEGGGLVLEVTSVDDGRLVRERAELSEAEAEALRRTVSQELGADGVPVSREGRGGLVLGSTLLGLGFYGWSVPVALGVDDARIGVATYLLTAAASFYFPYRLSRDRPVTDAHRSYTLWGATRGALYGGTLGFALTDRGGSTPGDDEGDDPWRVRLGLATAGSVAGAFLGYRAVGRAGLDEGAVAVRGTLTDFATAGGFATAYALGLYDDETTTGRDGLPATEEADLLPGNVLALASTAAGLYGAAVVADRQDYTVGDSHVLRSVGLLGAQTLLPVADLVDSDGGKTHAAAATVGAASGLWFGHRLLRRQDFSRGDGLLVAAGHLAGGLLGAGLTYLLNPRTDRDELIYLTTSAAGSAAGLALTYRALARDSDRGSSAFLTPVGCSGSGGRSCRNRSGP